jgi:hypothetical protein
MHGMTPCAHDGLRYSAGMRKIIRSADSFGIMLFQPNVTHVLFVLPILKANLSIALNEYAPRLRNQVEMLVACIASYEGKPVLVNDVMSWFSFDAMGEFTFGEDFGMMKEKRWQPALVRQQRALALLAPLNDTIWIVHFAFAFVPFLGKVKDWMQMVQFCDERMEKRMKVSISSSGCV